MVFLKILFIELIIVLSVVVALRMWVHFVSLHIEKRMN